MTDINKLPIAEADQLARAEIEHHRQQMGAWRLARARRVAAERRTRSVADIAADMDVHPQVVYDLLREASKADRSE